jgi:hypothetical protein
MYPPVLANVLLDADSLDSIEDSDLLCLRGNVEILGGDTVMVLGQFTSALLLLPSIEDLASGIARLRKGHKTIEVTLVGDTTSLWILERKHGATGGVVLAHRGAELGPIHRDDLEKALGDAVLTFLDGILARRGASSWGASAIQIVESVAEVWPGVARIIPGKTRRSG